LYLKRFSEDENHIYAYNKFTQKNYGTNINDIASKKYFYDLPENTEEVNPKFIETILSQIEQVC
jgi:hypothetical protein